MILRAVAAASAIAVVTGAAAVAVSAWSAGDGSGAAGGDTPSIAAAHTHDGSSETFGAENPAGPSPASGTAHSHGTPVTASPAQIACGADLVDRTREAIARFEDVNVALAEGYRADPRKPNATHYGNPKYKRDGRTLDLAHPESLVYLTRKDGTKKLVGALFTMARGESGPQPCGDVTHWHTHTNCILLDGTEGAKPVDGACAAGETLRTSNEMMHVWTGAGCKPVELSAGDDHRLLVCHNGVAEARATVRN